MITISMDNKRDIAFWILVLVVIISCGYFIFFIQSESFKCMSDPLTYGVSQYKTSDGEFTCTCSSPFANSIIVTKDGILPSYNYNTIFTTK